MVSEEDEEGLLARIVFKEEEWLSVGTLGSAILKPVCR